jgi:mono/diheme cytochrome c family protein
MLLKSLPRKSRRRRNEFARCYLIALLLLSGTLAFAQSQKSEPHSKPTSGGAVPRGKYIVESVAICAQCHTPRDNDGNPDRGHWLQGAPVPFDPVKPDPNWPLTAPRIGGTPLPASDAGMVKLLTTGIWTNGEHLRPPMPQFRLDQSDAEAVVAYLKSLNAQP